MRGFPSGEGETLSLLYLGLSFGSRGGAGLHLLPEKQMDEFLSLEIYFTNVCIQKQFRNIVKKLKSAKYSLFSETVLSPLDTKIYFI